MALQKRHSSRKPVVRRSLRVESLEVRNLLAADVESLWAPCQGAPASDVVGAFRVAGIVGASARSRAPATLSSSVVVAPPTTEVKMPESALPEGTFRLVERRSPPINVVVEQVVRIPEATRNPEGTIQLVDRARPPVATVALANGPAFLECPTDLVGAPHSESTAVVDSTIVTAVQPAVPAVQIDKGPALIVPCEPVVEPPPQASTPVLVATVEKRVDNVSESQCAPKADIANAVSHAGHGLQARETAFAESSAPPVGIKTRGRNKG